VGELEVTDEGSQCKLGDYTEEGYWAHVDGEVRAVQVTTVREGGTPREVVELTLTSDSVLGEPQGSYFKLFFQYEEAYHKLDLNNGSCLDWNTNITDYEQLFFEVLGESGEVSVDRSGRGDSSSAYGYTYTFSFDGDMVAGDMNMWLQTSLDLSHIRFTGEGDQDE